MKKIDKYKTQDGYEYDGVWHEDEENLLASGFCEFCGCGRPEDALNYVYNSLKLLNDKSEEDWTYEMWIEKEQELFPIIGSSYFMYYWLDNMEFTEHGGSVPGWLTDKGKELLELIEEYNDND